MKALLTFALILAATVAQAIPIQHLEFEQNNWYVTYDYHVTDSETGAIVRADEVYVNGQLFGYGISGFATVNHIMPANLPDDGLLFSLFVYGENNISIVEGGVFYAGPSFTLLQPTGPSPYVPPVFVPDAGNSAWLLLGSLAVLLPVRRRWSH
jgi:hypothetical protein